MLNTAFIHGNLQLINVSDIRVILPLNGTESCFCSSCFVFSLLSFQGYCWY